ncbi:hypothetical protein AI27_05605 [Sphingomonas sp. BHC-A]|nr:hypothetical protein AI27_05605 [Sphingomonas sp. BHC-A]
MSGEGLLSNYPPRDPGTCLCGRAMVHRYSSCATCADERDYRAGDHLSWGVTASSTMEHFSHDPNVND